jgi:hypothetical protein
MLPSILAGGLSLLLAAADQVGADVSAPAPMSAATAQAPVTRIPPAAFPTEEMAEQFAAYLAWTKAQGLSRLVAFEQPAPDRAHLSPNLVGGTRLPTPEMSRQFAAYLRWTREQGLSAYHAFQVSDFD